MSIRFKLEFVNPLYRISNHLKSAFVCTALLIINQSLGLAQEHPLSKHDSAVVIKYVANYETVLNDHGNMKEATRYLNDIAFIYWEHNQYQEAINYYKKSLIINIDIENENGIAMINNNLGMLHADILDYPASYDYFMQTLAARRSNNEKTGMISALINLSVVLNNLEKYDESIKDLEEALNLAREMNDADQMKSCYGMLSETFEKAGKPKQSIYYFQLYKTFTNLVQEEKMTELLNDYSEEKLLKQKLEVENKQNQEALAEKQRRLKVIEQQNRQFDEKLDQYDSLNKSLYENLDEKQLQLELLTKASEIMQLKASQEIQLSEMEKNREKRVSQVTLIITVSLILVVLIIIRYFWMEKKNAKRLKEKNEEIERQQAELLDLNNNLHQKVNERTENLQQAYDKLGEYIFSNSHEIRRPVANISGLLNLFNFQDMNDPQNIQYLKMLKESNSELDEILKKWNDNLTMSGNHLTKRPNE